MTTTLRSNPTEIIDHAERRLDDLKALRAELRRQSQPGDPQREERIADALLQQMLVMSGVRSLLARRPWEPELLSEPEEARLVAVSKALSAERRQIKKMRRVVVTY